MPIVQCVIWIIASGIGTGYLNIINPTIQLRGMFANGFTPAILIVIGKFLEITVTVILVILGIYNLGKALCTGFELLFILLNSLLSFILAIHFTNLLVVIIKVAYCLVNLLITGLCITFGNSIIHIGKLLLIRIEFLFCHCHNALIILFNHIHIIVELGTVNTLNLETICLVLNKIFTRNRLIYCNSGITELISILIYPLFYYLYNR